jgi:hypothetical protein
VRALRVSPLRVTAADVLSSDSTAGPVGQPLHPFHRRDALPRGPFKGGGDGGTMPKTDALRASVDTAGGRARRKRHLRNPPRTRTSVPEPQPHYRTIADLELPVWLPLAVASHARQISCRTKSDELMLRRLTSDPRMRGVWTELLKRKRSNYKSSNTFKYPATARMEWNPGSREGLRRAQTIRRMSTPEAERAANKIEMSVKLGWAADTVIWENSVRRPGLGDGKSSELLMQERALVSFFSQAFEFARTDSRPVPRAVAEKKRAHYLDMADRIRTDVADLDLFSTEALVDAAFAYEALADKAAPPLGHPLQVQRRRRGDERQTAFVLQLVDGSTAIFGQPLYGIVAIMANVAFDCENWTDARVRKVTKSIRPLISSFSIR